MIYIQTRIYIRLWNSRCNAFVTGCVNGVPNAQIQYHYIAILPTPLENRGEEEHKLNLQLQLEENFIALFRVLREEG